MDRARNRQLRVHDCVYAKSISGVIVPVKPEPVAAHISVVRCWVRLIITLPLVVLHSNRVRLLRQAPAQRTVCASLERTQPNGDVDRSRLLEGEHQARRRVSRHACWPSLSLSSSDDVRPTRFVRRVGPCRCANSSAGRASGAIAKFNRCRMVRLVGDLENSAKKAQCSRDARRSYTAHASYLQARTILTCGGCSGILRSHRPHFATRCCTTSCHETA